MVMRQMRENTKWIMLATAIAFGLLMVFEWGMDLTGITSGSLGEIGRVNRTPVMYEDYMNAYRLLFDQVQAEQTEVIGTLQNRQIEDAAWEQIVGRILIQQELDRRGIGVTEEEIRQAARFAPPPDLLTSPAFLTDGEFDLAKYQDYLTSSADPFLFEQLEAYYRSALPEGKLMRQLATGLYVTDGELWTQYADANETARVRYVPLDPAVRVPDDSVSITDREMRAYYSDHEDDFERPARAGVRVLVLPKVVSASDSAAVRERAEALLAEILAGSSFDSVGTRAAAAEPPAVFEDLGTFGRGVMTPPFDTAVFEAPVGRATGPVETSFGYHVVLVSERTASSATAKHILFPITRTEESEIRLLVLADSMEALVEDYSLEEVALRMNLLEVQLVEVSEVFPFVTGAGQVGEGADWAIREAVAGDVSEVFESDQAYYAMELISSEPGGVLPLEEAEPTIRQVLLQEKKIARGAAEAEELVERVRGGATLSAAATELGLEVLEPEPFTRQDFVPGLGRLNQAIGAAFGLPTGAVSEPVATSENVFVIEKLAHTPADSGAWLAQRGAQREQLTLLLQQQRLQQWVEGLRAAARIVDRREEVLQPPDSDSPLTPYLPF